MAGKQDTHPNAAREQTCRQQASPNHNRKLHDKPHAARACLEELQVIQRQRIVDVEGGILYLLVVVHQLDGGTSRAGAVP